jgi:tRNA threonylcarbamoyladenosine biosynthesis protein TsaE
VSVAREAVFTGVLKEADLRAWGRAIGRASPLGAVLCLSGPLGAGKSTLARAIGRGAGVAAGMLSPTFNLVFAYDLPGGGRVLHYDLYRLERAEDVRPLEWDELGAEDVLAVIEWPERAGGLLPDDRWEVRLEIAPDRPELRQVGVTPVGGPPPLPWPARR